MEWHLVKRKCLELRMNLSAKIGSCTEINLQRNWVCKDLKMTLEATMVPSTAEAVSGFKRNWTEMISSEELEKFLSPKVLSGEIEF